MTGTSGPTQIDYDQAEKHSAADGSWNGKPGLARAIRFLLWLVPLLGSLLFGLWASINVPPERLGVNRWVWWIGLAVLATCILRILEHLAAKLVPLTMLLRLSLIFPDQAPSRFKSALRTGTTTQTKKRIKSIQEGGGALEGDDDVAAQMLDLIGLLSKHDKMTRGHAERVRGYTDLLSAELGLNETDAGKLRWSALLHDMGKLDVPSEILNKPGRPDADEWAILQSHPAAANKHLEPIAEWLGEWRHAADGHHERWDGNGYPNKLAGKDIPLAARIVAVADAYDVMTSARSYKKPLPPEIARQEIADNAGTQFDPEIARAFLNIGLGDLRRATGPLAWIASLPGIRNVPLANTVTPVATNVATTAATTVAAITTAIAGVVAGELPPAPQGPLAFTEDVVEVATTLPPATLPPATSPPATFPPTTLTATTVPPATTAQLNRRPVAEASTFQLDSGETAELVLPSPATINTDAFVLNASDPDGDELTVVVDDDTQGGTASLVGDKIIFVPAADATSSSFSFAVFDGQSYSEPATVSFDIAPAPTTTVAIQTTTTAAPAAATTTTPAPTTTAAPTTTTTPTTTTSTTTTSTTTTTIPVDLPPSAITPQLFSVPEHQAGLPIGTITATDPEGEAVAYSLSGGNVAAFTVNTDTGQLSLAPGFQFDFEAEQSTTVIITATDPAGQSTPTLITVDVLPLNEPPVAQNLLESVHEDAVPGTVVGRVEVQDPDAGDTHIFDIVGGNTDLDGDGVKPFEVSPIGDVMVLDADDIDFGPNGQRFTLLVSFIDSGGLADMATVKVAVDTRHVLSGAAQKITFNELNVIGNEFAELINRTTDPIDLSNWRLTDGDVIANSLDLDPTWRLDYTFPAGSMLPAGGTALVADSLPIESGPTGAELELAGAWNDAMSSAGDELYLWDDSGSLVAFISWGDPLNGNNRNDTPPIELWDLWDPAYEATLVAQGDTRSMSLANQATPNESRCWEHTASNDATARCPGATATIDNAPLVERDHSAGAPNDRFTGPAPADQTFTISEDASAGTLVGTIDFNDPDSSEFVVGLRSGNLDIDGDGEPAFKRDQFGNVYVKDADDLDFGVDGQTFSLLVRATDEKSVSAEFELTIAVESRHTLSSFAGDIIITEVNWHNQYLAPTADDEFIEIQNVGSSAVELGGWRVADYDVLVGDLDANPLDFTVPGNGHLLWPGQKAVLWIGSASVADATAPGASRIFHTETFPALFHIGDDIWLYDDTGALVAYVAWGDDTHVDSTIDDRPPITAFGLWDPSFESELDFSQTPYATSIALAIDGDAVAATNSACWEPTGLDLAAARCPGALPTFDNDESSVRASSPGVDNQQPVYINRLVVSEYATNNAAPRVGDFIELYNGSNHTLDLSNYEIKLAFDGVLQTPIPLGDRLLGPGKFFLITPTGSPISANADLVLSTSSLPMSIGIKLYHQADPLVSWENWSATVDRVGSTEEHDGNPSSPALNPPAAPSDYREGPGLLQMHPVSNYEFTMERLRIGNGNCVDHDNNRTDFELKSSGTPANPQSSQDPAVFCSIPDVETTTASGLVISEFWVSGYDDFFDEGITIFNAGTTAASLADLEIRHTSSTENKLIHTFGPADPTTTLLPGQHILLRKDGSGPADIVFTSNFSDAYSSPRSTLLIDRSTSTILDEVLLNNVSDVTGLPPLTGYVERSWVRNNNGCADTGNSSLDFHMRFVRLDLGLGSDLSPCS